MTVTGFEATLLILAAATLVLTVLMRLRLPSPLAYLLIGMLVGPHAVGLLEQTELTAVLGEIGVTFLLFTIGLEFSLAQINAMRREVLGLGSVQVLVGTVSGGLIAYALGLSWQGALIAGGALSLSSTAIAVKQLTDQLELQAPHGRLAVAILLFQDLAAVPFLILIPVLAGTDSALLPTLIWALLKGVIAVAVVGFAGQRLLRPLYHQVGRTSAPELFTMTSLLVALAAAWVTHLMGLSLALGAFLAGMILGETEYRHQVELDIRPFRDILLGLFFITVGMELSFPVLLQWWPWILLIVIGLAVGKGAVIVALVRLGGQDMNTALRVGMSLAQGGEFGLALLALAASNGLLSGAVQQVLLGSLVTSMALAPILIKYNGPLAALAAHRRKRADQEVRAAELRAATKGMQDHVVICGFGESGRHVADVLSDEAIDFIAVDADSINVRQAWELSAPVFYADATHPGTLAATRIAHARALVITVPDADVSARILANARKSNPELPILVRAHSKTELARLIKAGASYGVPETVEVGQMLALELLVACDVPTQRVIEQFDSNRRARYGYDSS